MWQGEWRADETQPANFNFGRYDVAAAKRILQADPNREQMQLVLAGYGALQKMIAGVSYAGINLEVPLIVVRVGAGLLPIDGWSRIRKATSLGLNSLPAVRLTSKETNQIRLP